MLSKAKFLTKLSQHAFIRSLPVKLNAEIKPIKNLLIENRGLISVPLIKICKKFGIRTVSVYSDSNIKSLHASMTLPENNENGIHKFTMLMKEAKKIHSLMMKEVRREESGGGESEKRFNPTLIYLALYAIFVQWIAFLHASGIIFGNERTEKYFDLMGSITFISTLLLSIYLSPRALSLRQIILSSFVTLWTLRLGSFLFYRIHNNDGIDSRFTEIKKNNNEFLMVWSLQGVWVFLTLLPVLILNQSTKRYRMTLLDAGGFLLWIAGFIFETVADYQKFTFRSLPENKGNFMSSGLWAYSRHPNYFGEILLWLGVAISSFSGSKSYSVFISPIFVALLLIFVSGIPALEKKADQLYANNEEYQLYKKNTPVLIPFIGRKGNAEF